jgi:hypothetical protein
VKIQINNRYINCLVDQVEFLNEKMSIFLFVDIT